MTKSSLHELRFGIGKSLRYHAKRRSFFELLHRATMAIVAVGGSAAFASILGDISELATGAAFVLTVLATLDAAIGYSQKARQHDELFKRFSDLSIKLESEGRPKAQFIRELKAQRLLIEKDEPTELAALNIICYNEQAESMGYDDSHMRKVHGLQKLFAHLFTFPPNKFPPLSA